MRLFWPARRRASVALVATVALVLGTSCSPANQTDFSEAGSGVRLPASSSAATTNAVDRPRAEATVLADPAITLPSADAVPTKRPAPTSSPVPTTRSAPTTTQLSRAECDNLQSYLLEKVEPLEESHYAMATTDSDLWRKYQYDLSLMLISDIEWAAHRILDACPWSDWEGVERHFREAVRTREGLFRMCERLQDADPSFDWNCLG